MSWWQISGALTITHCDFKMRETYCFVNSLSASSLRMLRSLSKGLSALQWQHLLHVWLFDDKILQGLDDNIWGHWKSHIVTSKCGKHTVLWIPFEIDLFFVSPVQCSIFFVFYFVLYSLSYVMPFFFMGLASTLR